MSGRRTSYDIRLPVRPFFFTVDQVATLTALTTAQVNRMMFRTGRTAGLPPPDMVKAVNLAPPDAPDEWRIEEKELLRWLRHRGFAVLSRW